MSITQYTFYSYNVFQLPAIQPKFLVSYVYMYLVCKLETPYCGISSGSALFAKTKLIFGEKKYNIFLENITFGPSLYTMDHPDLIVCSLKIMENSIGLKMVKLLFNQFTGPS